MYLVLTGVPWSPGFRGGFDSVPCRYGWRVARVIDCPCVAPNPELIGKVSGRRSLPLLRPLLLPRTPTTMSDSAIHAVAGAAGGIVAMTAT